MPANQDDREKLARLFANHLHDTGTTSHYSRATVLGSELADIAAGFSRSAKDEGWIATHAGLPREETVVEVAVVGGNGKPYRAFGCRVDGGEGWLWALANSQHCEDPGDCDVDGDYDVFAWREPTPLPAVPAVRRFKILHDRGEDGRDDVAVVTGVDARDEQMTAIGEAARWEELPPTQADAGEGAAGVEDGSHP